MRKVFLITLLALAGGCGAAKTVRAQGPTYTIPQTVAQVLATGMQCTGFSQTFPVTNLGQTQHYVYLSASSGVTYISVVINGIDAAGNSYQISSSIHPTNTSLVPVVATGTGYFPKITVSVLCQPASSAMATFTLNYTGTSATSNQASGGYLTASMDKQLYSLQPAAAAQDISITPYGSSAGILQFNWGSGMAQTGASLTVECRDTNDVNEWTYPLPTTLGVTNFLVPATPCPLQYVTFVPGTGTTTFNLEYFYFPPGTQDPTRSNYQHITGTTATAITATVPGVLRSITVNTPAAGTISIFDLAAASCTGTPSTNTVAVITATSTAPLGTLGYNLAFLNGICVKASATMDLTVGYQ